MSYATVAEAQQRHKELGDRQRAMERELADVDLCAQLKRDFGEQWFKAWRTQRVQAIKDLVPQLAEAKKYIKDARRVSSEALARHNGVDFDASDPVAMVAALQAIVVDLVHESGLHMGAAPEGVRAVMSLADSFRCEGDRRMISWQEHLAALTQAEQRHKADMERLSEELTKQRVLLEKGRDQLAQVRGDLERERKSWQSVFAGEQRQPAPVVIRRQPVNLDGLKEQIEELRRRTARQQKALMAISQAAQTVTDRQQRARGITSQILITPDLQDVIDEALS